MFQKEAISPQKRVFHKIVNVNNLWITLSVFTKCGKQHNVIAFTTFTITIKQTTTTIVFIIFQQSVDRLSTTIVDC